MEIPRTRDVITLVKDCTRTVMVSDDMVRLGWPGGQGVAWIDSPDDTFLCSYSDGTYGGFLLWGSNETADQYNAFTLGQPTYKYAVLCVGCWLISTSTYERYTLESRVGGGPLVPNVFVPNGRLTFSLRGLFTPQDEWTIAGDPRGPNEFYVGHIVQPPSAANNYYLTIQTSI